MLTMTIDMPKPLFEQLDVINGKAKFDSVIRLTSVLLSPYAIPRRSDELFNAILIKRFSCLMIGCDNRNGFLPVLQQKKRMQPVTTYYNNAYNSYSNPVTIHVNDIVNVMGSVYVICPEAIAAIEPHLNSFSEIWDQFQLSIRPDNNQTQDESFNCSNGAYNVKVSNAGAQEVDGIYQEFISSAGVTSYVKNSRSGVFKIMPANGL